MGAVYATSFVLKRSSIGQNSFAIMQVGKEAGLVKGIKSGDGLY
jgi:hypothetical protein